MKCENCHEDMEAEVKRVELDRAQGLAVIVKFDVQFHCSDCGMYIVIPQYKALELQK